ncbi:MAG: peptide chain release factor N(5)-glutamine methyltransferase [Fuerstiella sp.]
MADSAASTDDVWTVQRILTWTTDFLKQKDVESPRREAELLLAHARNCPRIRLYTDLETPLTDAERRRMRDYVKRRAQREPLAYITGHREFYGRDFAVGAGVLVPRPETETLVDVCLERIPQDTPSRICEVGFGSGCIAVTLARQRPQCSVVASDTSEVALQFATQNVATHGVAAQVQLVSGDGLQAIRATTGELFDGLVSNPPYVCVHELSGLDPEVAVHEPREALVSGDDGLTLMRQIIAEAPGMLRPGGWLAVELDPAQCETVQHLLAEAGFIDIRTRQDLSGSDRIVEAALPG